MTTASPPAGQPATDDARLANEPDFPSAPAAQGPPSHSGQGGRSEPPPGSNAGAPPEDEEPTEEAPEEEEEEAPPEEPPADEEEKIAICHKAGSPDAKTLTVGASAVDEHLAHGDALGACP